VPLSPDSEGLLPVRFNQPVPVVARVEHQERETQLLDGVEGLYPEHCCFSVRMKRSAHPSPSGSRTNAGRDAMPRKASSSWKRSPPRGVKERVILAPEHALLQVRDRGRAGAGRRGLRGRPSSSTSRRCRPTVTASSRMRDSDTSRSGRSGFGDAADAAGHHPRAGSLPHVSRLTSHVFVEDRQSGTPLTLWPKAGSLPSRVPST